MWRECGVPGPAESHSHFAAGAREDTLRLKLLRPLRGLPPLLRPPRGPAADAGGIAARLRHHRHPERQVRELGYVATPRLQGCAECAHHHGGMDRGAVPARTAAGGAGQLGRRELLHHGHRCLGHQVPGEQLPQSALQINN